MPTKDPECECPETDGGGWWSAAHGRALARLLAERGWSQQAFADKSGVGLSALKNWLSGGVSRPRRFLLDQAARTLEVEIEVLLNPPGMGMELRGDDLAVLPRLSVQGESRSPPGEPNGGEAGRAAPAVSGSDEPGQAADADESRAHEGGPIAPASPSVSVRTPHFRPWVRPGLGLVALGLVAVAGLVFFAYWPETRAEREKRAALAALLVATELEARGLPKVDSDGLNAEEARCHLLRLRHHYAEYAFFVVMNDADRSGAFDPMPSRGYCWTPEGLRTSFCRQYMLECHPDWKGWSPNEADAEMTRIVESLIRARTSE